MTNPKVKQSCRVIVRNLSFLADEAGLGKALADIKPSPDVARDVCSASLRYALEDVSERLEFLEGLGSFVLLMEKPEAEDLLSSLNAEESSEMCTTPTREAPGTFREL